MKPIRRRLKKRNKRKKRINKRNRKVLKLNKRLTKTSVVNLWKIIAKKVKKNQSKGRKKKQTE